MFARPRPPAWLRRGLLPVIMGMPFCLAAAQAADPAPFDLPGPNIRVSVTRGAVTLPISEVPSLSTGDKLSIRADLPADQTARFILLSAFLHGATNPPPKNWIRAAETWKRKNKQSSLSLTVPEGARQFALFLVPDTGGAVDAISDTIRARPGEFVRATQDLNQASLDRSRLNTFMAAVNAEGSTHPEYLSTIAPTLAQSLSIKLNEQCLQKMVELQASCLIENREALVLADVHSSSMAETLAGAPADIALQLSATREAGYGFYSPYIGVIRDIAHIFGAFSSPQFNYLPTISLGRGDTMALLLNAAPSFAKPKSVLVAAMPAVEDDHPPRLRSAADGPLCASRPGLLLPVAGAPLIYSTSYARKMTLHLTSAEGKTADIPIEPRADKGGYVLKQVDPVATGFSGPAKGRLQGFWGFDRFQGPEFLLQFPTNAPWQLSGEEPKLDAGQSGAVTLRGTASACVESVTLRHGASKPRIVQWKVAGDGAITFPIAANDVQPGDIMIEVKQYGMATPTIVTIHIEPPGAPPGGPQPISIIAAPII